jgi:multidrug efflux pump subunit AcrA (membrane-fusion protein)
MTQKLRDLWRKRRTLVFVVVLSAASSALYGVAHLSTKSPTVPTFQVKRGEFLDVLQFRGQLKAMKSVTITAPANAGDLQIVKLATDGTQVKKGDVVVEFDPSKTQQDLAQDQSLLKSSQAEIEQVRAEGGLK